MSFKRKLSCILTVIAICTSIFTFGITASANSGMDNPVDKDPQMVLAKIYSQHFGVSVEESLNRLKLQYAFPDLEPALEKNESDSFGGVWIQHEPEYKIVVAFTVEGVKTLDKYSEYIPEDVTQYIEVRTVEKSLVELLNDQQKILTSMKENGIEIQSRVDVKNNCVSIDLQKIDKGKYDQANQNGRLSIPDKLRINLVDGLAVDITDLYGGLDLDYSDSSPSCTSGFSVEHNTTGVKGVLTAAHCYNYLYYDGTALTFAGSVEGGSYDVQWHTKSGWNIENKFQWWDDEDYTFDVTSIKTRSQQTIGSIVSKYGRTTHYTAGELTSKTTTLPSPYNSATWMEVDNIYNYAKLLDEGDSGGPWFNGNIALGISKARSEDYDTAYYMALDYLDMLDVSVLTD
jgi:hypothetical protein